MKIEDILLPFSSISYNCTFSGWLHYFFKSNAPSSVGLIHRWVTTFYFSYFIAKTKIVFGRFYRFYLASWPISFSLFMTELDERELKLCVCVTDELKVFHCPVWFSQTKNSQDENRRRRGKNPATLEPRGHSAQSRHRGDGEIIFPFSA